MRWKIKSWQEVYVSTFLDIYLSNTDVQIVYWLSFTFFCTFVPSVFHILSLSPSVWPPLSPLSTFYCHCLLHSCSLATTKSLFPSFTLSPWLSFISLPLSSPLSYTHTHTHTHLHTHTRRFAKSSLFLLLIFSFFLSLPLPPHSARLTLASLSLSSCLPSFFISN